ncbi:MAG: hypothetical protein ACJA01_003827 [Saprospiraceae bacterium]
MGGFISTRIFCFAFSSIGKNERIINKQINQRNEKRNIQNKTSKMKNTSSHLKNPPQPALGMEGETVIQRSVGKVEIEGRGLKGKWAALFRREFFVSFFLRLEKMKE